MTNPQDPRRAAGWHRRLSNLQLAIYIAVPVVFLVVCCGCLGWWYSHD